MATAAKGPSFDEIAKIPDQDLEEIIAAIKKGAEHPGDALGFGPEALNAIENMALSYYRTKMYDKAAVIFGFVLQMNSARATGWRGLGACMHALKRYELATLCYQSAVQADPNDVVSKVYWGEVLCQTGKKAEGLKLLKEVTAKGTKNDDYKPYVTRARAVVAADGGIPARLVLKKQGEKLAQDAGEALLQGAAGPEYDENREISVEDMQKNPELKKLLGDLAKAVEEGRLTYAQVGGFSQMELDGAYACACKYAEMGQVLQAIQIAGFLMFLDPYGGRYYQLVGICLQRMKQYENADHYYNMALLFDKEDPMSLVYRGESKIMSGKTDEGLQFVKRGIAAAKGKAEHKDIVDRGQVLVRQFGG
ncbi:MAG: hypothetical protein HY903_06555 [Deltaproteobacteria bacterium]|nr:hypothetical protein [Deltaproteobacteria bacterium]